MGVVKSTQGRELGVWAHPVPVPVGCGVSSMFYVGRRVLVPCQQQANRSTPTCHPVQTRGLCPPAGTVCDRQEMPNGVCTLKTTTHGHQGVREWLQGRRMP